MLKNPVGMKRYFVRKIRGNVSPISLSDVYSCYWQRAVVDVLTMIGAQMGSDNRSDMVALLGTHCAIPFHNCNSNTNLPYLLLYGLFKTRQCGCNLLYYAVWDDVILPSH